MKTAPWWSVIAVFITCITLVVVANLRVSAEQQRTRQVVCAGLADDQAGEQDKLRAYAAEPPTTAAGKAQRDAVQQAATRFAARAQRLGCTD